MRGNHQHGGYSNYTEWKKKDPESYWAMIEDREEKLKLKIDEDFARLIASFGGPKTSWDRQIAAAVKGEPTPQIRYDEPTKIEKRQKWYVRFWGWIKRFFGFKEKESNPMAEPIVPKIAYHEGVRVDPNFDMDKWLTESLSKVDKAVKEDGKADGEILCPICFNKRLYAVMDDGVIKTSCDTCRINRM